MTNVIIRNFSKISSSDKEMYFHIFKYLYNLQQQQQQKCIYR